MQSIDDIHSQLVGWHLKKHSFTGNNIPSSASEYMLARLASQILLPLTILGNLTITYGFTSPELNRYIQRYSPTGTAPTIDQHACCELNTKGSPISHRPGAACDFLVEGYEQRMHEVALHICQNLSFDKLYFYGRNQPLHISVSEDPFRHLQVMHQSATGRRYPGKKAFGDNALALAREL